MNFCYTEARAATVWDIDGHSYLDATAGLWLANVGRGRHEIADAMAEQAARLAAYSTFGDVAVDTMAAFADELADLARR